MRIERPVPGFMINVTCLLNPGIFTKYYEGLFIIPEEETVRLKE